MNAYELADKQAFDTDLSMWTRNETANMLRQQADRIAELEKQVKFLEEKCVMVEPLDDSHYPFRAFLKKGNENE